MIKIIKQFKNKKIQILKNCKCKKIEVQIKYRVKFHLKI